MLKQITGEIAKKNLNIYSIAVMDRDGICCERIISADRCTNSYSVAKAFTTTAIGLLWDQGKIRVEDKVYDILSDEFPSEFDSRWKDMTVEHLLKHRAGFKLGFLDIDADDIANYKTDDFLTYVLSSPLLYAPGTHYEYSDAVFYVLSRIVSKISGQCLIDFLRPVLFGNLEYQELAWSTCPFGYSMGGTGLYISTEDMVKLGFVYANDGCYYGKRILSSEWVKLVLERQYEFSKIGDTGIYAKGGAYGQMLCFSPEHHISCAWHGFEEKDVHVLIYEFNRVYCNN